MELLKRILYAKNLLMVMVIWIAPMTYGHGHATHVPGEGTGPPITGAHPSHVAHPSHGAQPSHGAHPSHGVHPSHAAHPSHGVHPSHGAHPSHGVHPHPSHGVHPSHGAHPSHGGLGPHSGWGHGRATFYGDINGGQTQQGACGYGDLHKQGYGLETAALSTALFNNGSRCGACFEIKCVDAPQWCLPGSIKITATNFCPPDFSKPKDCWCNPPQKHFDLSQPMFLKIAKYKAGVVPVKFRRVPCAKIGGVKFEIKGNPHFLMILPYNVGGAGDVRAMQVKGTRTEWIAMKKNWGQIWSTGVVLTGQCLSFRVTTSDGITKEFIDVTPPDWKCNGQSFDGKINF